MRNEIETIPIIDDIPNVFLYSFPAYIKMRHLIHFFTGLPASLKSGQHFRTQRLARSRAFDLGRFTRIKYERKKISCAVEMIFLGAISGANFHFFAADTANSSHSG